MDRFARDAGEAIDWHDKIWYPSKSQLGAPWVPATNQTDEKSSLSRVEVLFYLYMVQTILAGLGMFKLLKNLKSQFWEIYL